ncbi:MULTISPECIES: tRNA uridine-5-carboxymethylaminomethyl(34) synthesis GTPase MnmE [Tissierellales]|jgi:tRNA modification GTPase|uniref:tRNA modification GTPase MnmE n=1 Tax=Acidilutibacter cellobiosedens TaxID=2507161 RepID=A0A410QHA0_9FIRM|nr:MULTISPECIES: tRNA uridine-5-carboxymethylaminomethyl(34) synthesis GTPase MnmE [Tissierellales]MBE6082941.1 tRNA uridine-5-carboxymethylaminomethyl(34) synthesis GTPase MnmE [Tissierellaceae bacterium]QAT63326.1 tRNA uridine-5-carboxymethylaminomethyl(34) synthesis GTPase MnmE [Acidilutibacter cellobiosedens]SCL96471.1 tRNA modification GTPase MnmE [Sporanaerobacter sp. PP17-6a]
MESTIAAISTTVGESGIGIVRMSGKDSLSIAGKIFEGKKTKNLKDAENRKITYGHIFDPTDGSLVDEVLIVFMKAPFTYTREDIVEIYCHGGIISVRKILELLLANGAVMAERGEFTKRAFLNGRLDLSQAEAVIDIIKSKTELSCKLSLNQLEGGLSSEIKRIMDELTEMVAHVEVSIDFPEEDFEEITYDELELKSKKILDEIDNLLNTSERGRILREGLNVVILGKPNVGKSSLLNSMLRENRAIVTDIPGTTRDTIEEYMNIDGIPLKIVDTAGIRNTENIIEKIGVDKAKNLLETADLTIAVFDSSKELEEDDYEIINMIKDKKGIALLNKMDLDSKLTMEDLKKLIPEMKIIPTIISQKIGIQDIENNIKDMFYGGKVKIKNDIMVTNIRHKKKLIDAKKNISDAYTGIISKVPLDCLEVDLKNCWTNLGEISGDTVTEDILDKIFSEFCVGK